MKFDLELYGKNEFSPKCINAINNKTYHVLKVNNKEKEDYMHQKFEEFIKNQHNNIKEKHYIGIDFEFNRVSKGDRDVALMQINMENDSNIGMIFVLNPLILSTNKLLIKLITNRMMIKILHGAESLDIPYLFNQLLITKENIDNFCSNFYDTKFLCDYKNEELLQSSTFLENKPPRCGIYYLLLSNNIITEKIFNNLEKIEEKTGPIYLIHIDINKLSFDVLRYSLYDVLFLPELIKKFLVLDIPYTKIVPEVSCLINKYKRNIENEFNNLATIINTLNIYYIVDGNQNVLLRDIWELYYYTFTDSNKYFDKIKEIHYFKYFFEIITKFIVYVNILKYSKVYKKSNETIYFEKGNIYSGKDSLLMENYEQYYKWLNNYPELNKIIIQIDKQVNIDLQKHIHKK